ncbi:MAG TPA: hypothetical protein VGQ19_06550, partial [Burkholderiales bacterium]|nr:hypothetical protein [Burkholderiales bacterium]
WHQGAVYGATAALAVSGTIWLVLHYFFAVPGEYGPQTHPLEPWMLRLHGAAAMAALVIYGSLLPVHVRRAWSIRRNIALGIGLVSIMLLLTVTGYLLYYSGDENARPVISAAHWILGLVVPALLAWHIVPGACRTGPAKREPNRWRTASESGYPLARAGRNLRGCAAVHRRQVHERGSGEGSDLPVGR